jgi:Ca-activated chloride channel family protein
MQMIAKDVKIQVEFNPDNVAEYRLIGYENRQLANEDFNNDKVDAGDIGAGHKVTALYEITLTDSKHKFNDERRYTSSESSQKKATESDNTADELAYVKLRYKPTDSDTSQLIDTIVKKQDIKTFAQQSDDFKFASAVASFAQRLKSSKYAANIDYQWITQTALQTKGKDEFGYRSEFIQLVRNAEMSLIRIVNDLAK